MEFHASIEEHIKKRMEAVGMADYEIQTYSHTLVNAIAGTLNPINAYNEFYYLVARTVPADLIIMSDTHNFTLKDAQNYNGVDIYKLHEFSGLVRFETNNYNQEIEFLRVVPTKNRVKEILSLDKANESVAQKFSRFMWDLFVSKNPQYKKAA